MKTVLQVCLPYAYLVILVRCLFTFSYFFHIDANLRPSCIDCRLLRPARLRVDSESLHPKRWRSPLVGPRELYEKAGTSWKGFSEAPSRQSQNWWWCRSCFQTLWFHLIQQRCEDAKSIQVSYGNLQDFPYQGPCAACVHLSPSPALVWLLCFPGLVCSQSSFYFWSSRSFIRSDVVSALCFVVHLST
jgi:hypothetical protein